MPHIPLFAGNPPASKRPAPYVYYLAFFAALNSVNLGFDIGVNSGIGYRLQSKDSLGLSDLELEAFMGLFGWFSLVGALSAHRLSDDYGRRGAFVGAAVSFIVGILWTVLSPTLGVMLVGRCIMGVGVGLGLAEGPEVHDASRPVAQHGLGSALNDGEAP